MAKTNQTENSLVDMRSTNNDMYRAYLATFQTASEKETLFIAACQKYNNLELPKVRDEYFSARGTLYEAIAPYLFSQPKFKSLQGREWEFGELMRSIWQKYLQAHLILSGKLYPGELVNEWDERQDEILEFQSLERALESIKSIDWNDFRNGGHCIDIRIGNKSLIKIKNERLMMPIFDLLEDWVNKKTETINKHEGYYLEKNKNKKNLYFHNRKDMSAEICGFLYKFLPLPPPRGEHPTAYSEFIAELYNLLQLPIYKGRKEVKRKYVDDKLYDKSHIRQDLKGYKYSPPPKRSS